MKIKIFCRCCLFPSWYDHTGVLITAFRYSWFKNGRLLSNQKISWEYSLSHDVIHLCVMPSTFTPYEWKFRFFCVNYFLLNYWTLYEVSTLLTCLHFLETEFLAIIPNPSKWATWWNSNTIDRALIHSSHG